MAEQQTTTTPAPLAEMSLAEYRGSREIAETPAPKAQPATEPAAGASDAKPLVESDVDEKGAAETETEQDGGAEDDSEPGNKKKGGFQRKIEKQQREIEELKRQLAEKATSVAANKGETAGDATAPAASAEQPKYEDAVPKPKLEDFDTMEAFTEALTDWKADEREWKRDQAKAQEAARSEGQRIVEGWNTRKAEFQKEHSDYDDVLKTADHIQLPRAQQRLILESEVGPQLAYHLAQNKEELSKLAQMDPLQAAKAIARLEAKLTPSESRSVNTTTEPKGSSAPPPIRPVSASSRGAASPDLKKLALSDYRQLRESGRLK